VTGATLEVYRSLPDTMSDNEAQRFVGIYETEFGKEPYNERYRPGEIENDVLRPSRENGLVILGQATFEDGSQDIIGLACAVPLEEAPDEVQEFTYANAGELDIIARGRSTWYFSELAVASEHQKDAALHAGSALVRATLGHIDREGGTSFIMRSDADNSHSFRLFVRAGARILSAEQRIDNAQSVLSSGSESTNKRYAMGFTPNTSLPGSNAIELLTR
jgi:hypothetical protein